MAPEPPACSVIPVSVSENKSPADGPPLTPSCRPIEKPPTPTEPRPAPVNEPVPPVTWNVWAAIVPLIPANDQSVTVDGL